MSKYFLQRKRQEYINLPKNTKKELILFNPIILSSNLISKYTLTYFNNDAINVALLVESRIFYNTEFILGQFSRFLPNDFAMWIYVTKNVYYDYLEITQKLNNNINLKILPDQFKLSSNKDYNNLMLDINFWNLFIQFERVLIFQSTSMMYHSGIEQYYKYDFIGAPFNPEHKISTNVGNGNISFRNIRAMIYCLKNKSKVRILRYKTYLENIKKYNNNHAEYIFYAYAMNQFKYNIASIETAALFVIKDHMYNDECMFSNKLYIFNRELYTKLLLKSIGLTLEDITLTDADPNVPIVANTDSNVPTVTIILTESTSNTETIVTVNRTNYKQRNSEYYKIILTKNNNIILPSIDYVSDTTDRFVTIISIDEPNYKPINKPNYKQIMYNSSKLTGKNRYIPKNKPLLIENSIPSNNIDISRSIPMKHLAQNRYIPKNKPLLIENSIPSNNIDISRNIPMKHLAQNRYIPKNKPLLIENSISSNNIDISRNIPMKHLAQNRYMPKNKPLLIENSIPSNNIDISRSIPMKHLAQNRYMPKNKPVLIENSIPSNNIDIYKSIPMKHLAPNRYMSKDKPLIIENSIPKLVPVYKYLDPKLIERYPLSQFNNNSKNVALMLESRMFENTEFILRQYSRYLPEDFAMWIYVTPNVYSSYVELANKLNNNINILELPNQYVLNSVNDYNNIMLNISFLTLLQQFERVLIFQMDSMIYRKGIESYYEYDYIGAPWNPNSNMATSVGNGGLSLRNIQAMIYCLQNRKNVHVGCFNKKNIAEDVFYAYAMSQFGYKVADVETALSFSIESYGYNENSLGSHKLFVYNSELYDKLVLRSVYNNNSLESNVYIIGGVAVGGASKFINEFKEYFPNAIQIKSNNIFQLLSFSKNDILFIQHLVDDITPSIISNIKKKYQCRIIISIHDFYYMRNIYNPANGYLFNNIQIPDNILNLFKDAELVIHPSKFTFTHYSRYLSTDNFIISPHIDFKNLDSKLNIPLIINNTINIGVMHEFSEYKGKELIRYLMNKITNYRGYKVEFKIVGRNIKIYNENEFFESLNIYNIHCLTALNKWGETYCYSLSKFLKSGLPIIYNSIGAVSERMPNKEYYFKVFNNEYEINTNNPILNQKFLEMLDYVILNQSNLPRNYLDLTLEVPKLYDNLFNLKETDLVYLNKNNPFNIKAYCIYFPQFHTFKENDINYYENYTDITNLELLIKETGIKQDTPSYELLPIKNITDYDLLRNEKLIQKQIDLIEENNISGFAIYYYWFSINTITNQNMIMDRVINRFFSDDINMKERKVFFIWANESWSKSSSFGNKNNEIIDNNYNEYEFIQNIDNLLKYFKHKNYLKIDNKPVLFIHHPWFIPIDQLDIFKTLIEAKCIKNNFNGCNLIINSMCGTYSDYKHYEHHFKYSKIKNNKAIFEQKLDLDYKAYTNNINKINNTEKNIKTIAFNFDNRARLYKPNRLKNSTVTIKNDKRTCLEFMNKISGSYKDSINEIDKIMLINSWNEWGEQMAIEPSNEKGTYYLDLLKYIL
jgi:hypothetical protein